MGQVGVFYLRRWKRCIEIRFLKFRSILLVVIGLILVTAGYKLFIKPIPSPEKIIVYKDGKSVIFNSSSKDFNRLLNLTLQRLPLKMSTVQLAIRDDEWELWIQQQPFGMEFVYNNEQKFEKVSYTRLFFQLVSNSNDFSELMFFGNNGKVLPGPKGPLESPQELLHYLQKLN
jgi:hypothetical protein